MSVGTIIGHSYFGKGKVIDITGETITADFGYPYGVRAVKLRDIAEAAG